MIKIRHLCSGMILTMVMAMGLSVAAAPTEDLSYHYVSLDDIELPPGFVFFDPIGIDGARRVYGTLYEDNGTTWIPYVAAYDGDLQILGGPGYVNTVNEKGTVGGSLVDIATGQGKAALFRDGKIEIIPSFAGTYTSFVSSLSDNGIALVISYDQNFVSKPALYNGGRLIQVPISGFYFDVNNQGQISGTYYEPGVGYRGFRFESRTGKTTTLEPISTDPHAWALEINNHGDVLGYSFVFGSVERIGIWDRNAAFQVHFTEGTDQYPTVSNSLLMNDDELIVITLTTDGDSYLVPEPGVRLSLKSLVVNPPKSPDAFSSISAMNQHGDLLGNGGAGSFILLRE